MNIRGVEQAQRQLVNLEKEVKAAQRRGEKKIADRIATEAISRAPGSIGGRITVSQTEQLTTIDASSDGSPLSAYNEFGTGEYATQYLSGQPPEVQEEAKKFYINGRGRIPAKPFFFPAIYRNIDQLVPAIEEELQKIGK